MGMPSNPSQEPENQGGPASSKRPGAPAPGAHDRALADLDRFALTLHEIRNLLDGSMRCVLLAQRALDQANDPRGVLLDASRHLGVASTAMERMAGLTHAAMQGPGLSLGSSLLSSTRPVTLGEAIAHAVDVARPIAAEHGTQIECRIAPRVEKAPAGPLYAVVLNALRNAVESIRSAGGKGRIQVVALPTLGPVPKGQPVFAKSPLWVDIEITDDGTGITDRAAVERIFAGAWSARADGTGLGLAVARGVVAELGGHVELRTRTDRPGHARPGAAMRVLAPLHDAGKTGEDAA